VLNGASREGGGSNCFEQSQMRASKSRREPVWYIPPGGPIRFQTPQLSIKLFIASHTPVRPRPRVPIREGFVGYLSQGASFKASWTLTRGTDPKC
jgi:hypothetical protein